VNDLKMLFFEHPHEFVNVKEAAGRLRTSEGTVRRWVRLGKLKAFRVGRALWIYIPSIERQIRAPNDDEL
jgi:excisionase family DNA binding protein